MLAEGRKFPEPMAFLFTVQSFWQTTIQITLNVITRPQPYILFIVVLHSQIKFISKQVKSLLEVSVGVKFLRNCLNWIAIYVKLIFDNWETYHIVSNKKIVQNVLQSAQYTEILILHKIWSFLLTISLVNVTRSVVSFGFGPIYCINSYSKI